MCVCVCVCVCMCEWRSWGRRCLGSQRTEVLASLCNWYTRAFVWSVGSVGRAVEMTGLE